MCCDQILSAITRLLIKFVIDGLQAGRNNFTINGKNNRLYIFGLHPGAAIFIAGIDGCSLIVNNFLIFSNVRWNYCKRKYANQ